MRTALLMEILSQPTAPFREEHVRSVIEEALETHSVPYFSDPFGNLVLGCASKKEYLDRLKGSQGRKTSPLRLFIAHMDHPGFHGERWVKERELSIQWHGGSPTRHLHGASVWLATRDGWAGVGKLKRVQLLKNRRAIAKAIVEVPVGSQTRASTVSPEEIFGGFKFREAVWRKGSRLYTKAADDLVGAFAITSLAIDHSRKKGSDFIGLLTRAEEVGFIGAIAHFKTGWLQSTRRPLICVSIETSRTLKGAEIGKGPVVRLGDKATVFDAAYLNVLSEVAQRRAPGRFQRRIMDGGTCEATAALAFGLRAIGISVPLGNYHNQSFEGGPDSRGKHGPSPEFVDLKDVEMLLKLCEALLQQNLPWQAPWKKRVAELSQKLREYKPLLEKY